MQREPGNEATWRVQANSISCSVFVREKEKEIHHLSLNLFFVLFRKKPMVASFLGSPRAQTKNRKERGEPGKIYHVRNVIGRENLITCGRTNELVWTTVIQLR